MTVVSRLVKRSTPSPNSLHADAIELPGVSYSDLPRFEQRLHGEQALYLKFR